MRAISKAIAATGLIASGLMLSGGAMAAEKPKLTQEQKLAKALEGRVEGKPVDCIMQRDIRATRIYDRVAIVYEMSNGTWYVNRPASGASSLSRNDVLVTDTRSNQLCSIDVVRLLDSSTRMQNGFVGLDKFVPWTKPKKK